MKFVLFKSRNLLAVITVFSLFALEARAFQMDGLKWLAGSWLACSEMGSYEVYFKSEAGTITGIMRMASPSSDTVSLDFVQIGQDGSDLILKGQQMVGPMPPILMKAMVLSETQVVFENITSGFPQKITYTLKSADELSDHVEGNLSGQPFNNEFLLKKVFTPTHCGK